MIRKSCLAVGFISLLFGWFSHTSLALACSCVSATSAEHFANASAVFVGVVSDVMTSSGGKTADLVVTQALKGVVLPKMSVVTGLGDADCGYDFKEGQSYVVYANGDEQLQTSICSGTMMIGDEPLPVEEPQIIIDDGSNLLVTTVVLSSAFGAGMLTMYLWGRSRMNR